MELHLSVQKSLIDQLGKTGASGQEERKPSDVYEGEFTTKLLSFLLL